MSQNDEGGAGRGAGSADAPTQAMAHGSAGGDTAAFARPGGERPSRVAGGAPAAGAGSALGAARRPGVGRPGAARPAEGRPAAGRPPVRTRRAKLALRRIDPWSVFLFSLLASIFLGIVLVVAVTVLYAVLANLGVLESINDLFGEVAGDGEGGAASSPELITSGRVLSGAAVLAAVDIVLLTALATLGALLYNLCAALTGGIEVTLGERD